MGIELDLVTKDASGNVTARSELDGVNGAAKVYVASLHAGEDQAAGLQNVFEGGGEYEVVPASSTDLVLGVTGSVGDYLHCVVLSVTAAGTVTIKDNATTIFTHAFTAAVAIPVEVPIKLRSLSGAWKVTTPAGVSGFARGVFT